MLRWQPQRLHERTRFLTKLLGASVAIHIVACLCLFFYQAGGGKIRFNTKTLVGRDVIVKVLPFGQKKPATALTAGGSKKSGKATALKTSVIKTQKAKPVPKQKTVAKKTSKATTSKKDVGGLQKKTTKSVPKKIAQQAVAPKPEPLKKELTPVIEEQKTVEKKELVPEAPVQPAVQTKDTPEQPTPVQTDASVQPVAAESQAGTVGEQVMYVNQEELADIELQRLLADALAQAWHPPVGIPASVECQAVIEVDWQGALASYKLTQTSGIMIYDVSVEEGIKALTFPRAVWGKTIELIFKPWAES